MTAPQPPRPTDDPEFVGVIHLRYPSKDADPEVYRHFDWYSGEVSVTGDISRAEGTPTVTRAEIRTTAVGGITHAVLRSVPLGEVLKAARSDVAQDAPARIEPDYRLPPGRVAITDDLLRNVSLALIKETRPGKDRQANRRLAEAFGRPEGTVRTWVARARQAGWLAPGASGRMDAQAGPKLLLWLGAQMNTDAILTKALVVDAKDMGVKDPAAAAAIALRAMRNFALSDFPQRLGEAPSRVQLAAAELYRRTADEEWRARIDDGEDDEAAFEEIADEIRARLAKAEQ
jgi:hypothetical protein